MGEESSIKNLFYATVDGGEWKELNVVEELDIDRETIEENSPVYWDNSLAGTISFDVKMTPSFEKFLVFHEKMHNTINRMARLMSHKKLRVRKKNRNRLHRYMKKHKISKVEFELAE